MSMNNLKEEELQSLIKVLSDGDVAEFEYEDESKRIKLVLDSRKELDSKIAEPK